MDDYFSIPGPSSSSNTTIIRDIEDGGGNQPSTTIICLASDEEEEEEEEIEDEDEKYLQLLENLLQQNQKISNFIREKRQEYCCRLMLNDERFEQDVDHQEDDSETISIGNHKQSRRTISIFFKPYFRDKDGLRAPYPFDISGFLVDQNLLSILLTPKHSRPWTNSETQQLLTQVSSQFVQRICSDLAQQLERLLEKNQSENYPDDNDEEDKSKIFEINRLNSELALARSRNDHPPDRWNEDIDWLMIAKYLEADDRNSEDCELYYNNQLHPSINKGPWTAEEDSKLLEIVSSFDNSMGIWDLISEKLGTGRLAWQCCSRFQSTLNQEIRPKGTIDGDEAEQILNTIEHFRTGEYVNWDNVKCLVEGRTISQVKYFWYKRKRPVVVKKWSALEDRVILAGYRLYGPKHWKKIAYFLPNRTNRQARQRYTNALCFSEQRKFGHWTEPEDELIIEMAAKYIRPADNQINFPEIRRTYFPNRAISQLYRRYRYLRRVLPEEVFSDQTDQSVPLSERSSSSTIFQNTITRKRYPGQCAHRKPIKFTMTDPKLIERFLFKSKKKLQNLPENCWHSKKKMSRNVSVDDGKSEDDDDLDEDEENDEDDIPEDTGRIIVSNFTERPQPISSHLDDALGLYAQLEQLNRRTKNRVTIPLQSIDEMANRMLTMVIAETVDWQHCEKNQRLPKECFVTNKSSTLGEIAWKCSDFGVDMIRFFVTQSGCHVYSGGDFDDGNSIEVAKSLYVPNQSTLFGYSILRLLTNSLLFRLVDVEFERHDPETLMAAEEEEEEEEDFDEQDIVANPAFTEISSIFNSLFLWPALLALKTGGSGSNDDEDLASDLEFRQTILANCENSHRDLSDNCDLNPTSEEPQSDSTEITSKSSKITSKSSEITSKFSEITSKSSEITSKSSEITSKSSKITSKSSGTPATPSTGRRGRPKKRIFFQPVDQFVLNRSIQSQLFFTQYNEKVLNQLYEFKLRIEEMDGNSNKFWIFENRSRLLDRTETFVRIVFDGIRETLEERSKNQKELEQSKTPIGGKKRGRKSASELASATTLNSNETSNCLEIERRQSNRKRQSRFDLKQILPKSTSSSSKSNK